MVLNRRNWSLSGKWRLDPFAGDAGVWALSTAAGRKNSTRRALETERVMQEEYQEGKKESVILMSLLNSPEPQSLIGPAGKLEFRFPAKGPG
jgi:hypothetical protein